MSMNVKLKMKTLVKLYDEMHDIKGECVLVGFINIFTTSCSELASH